MPRALSLWLDYGSYQAKGGWVGTLVTIHYKGFFPLEQRFIIGYCIVDKLELHMYGRYISFF